MGRKRQQITKLRRADIYHRIMRGEKPQDVIDYYTSNFDLKEITIRVDIGEVYKEIDKDSERDIDYVMSLHEKRYEEIYAEIDGLLEQWQELSTEDEKNANKKKAEIIDKYKNAMKALHQKEKLLGLHKKNVNVLVKNTNVNKTKQRNELENLDLSYLSLDEKKEMLSLLKECKKEEEEGIQPIRYKEYNNYVNVEVTEQTEVEEEDVIETEGVYEQFQDVTPEEEKREIEERKQLEPKGHDKEQVGEKLKEAMRKQIAESQKNKK